MFLPESSGQGFGGYYGSRRPSGVGRLGKECGVVGDGVGLAISQGRMNLRKKSWYPSPPCAMDSIEWGGGGGRGLKKEKEVPCRSSEQQS